jgi:hypothetical protein
MRLSERRGELRREYINDWMKREIFGSEKPISFSCKKQKCFALKTVSRTWIAFFHQRMVPEFDGSIQMIHGESDYCVEEARLFNHIT